MSSSTAHGSLWLDAVELPDFAPLQAPAECDVVVVGAGITGLTLALEPGTWPGATARVHEVGLSAVAALPALPFPIADGFCLHDQGRLHASRYMAALAAAVQAAGGHVYTHTPVLDVDGGAPCTVHTQGATVQASDVVLATHTPIGIDPLHTVVFPMRSYVLAAVVDDVLPDALVWNTHDPYEYIRKQPMPTSDHAGDGAGDRSSPAASIRWPGPAGRRASTSVAWARWCKLHWNPAEATWDCPCHGGRFDIGGAVIEGPPTRPLSRP